MSIFEGYGAFNKSIDENRVLVKTQNQNGSVDLDGSSLLAQVSVLVCRDEMAKPSTAVRLTVPRWYISAAVSSHCFYCSTKTYLYNFDPLKSHFYIVKLGFTGLYIICVISAQKHRL